MDDVCLSPRAIFFDVGETLVRARRPYGELLAGLSQRAGLDLPAEALDGLAAHIDARVTLRTQQLQPFTFPATESQRFWFDTYHGYFIRFLSEADAVRLAHAFRDLLSSAAGYVPFEDTIPTLVRLRERGHQLGIISNWEAWLPALLAAAGIAPFFDHVIISGVCGVEKPDPGIFTLALQEGGYQPEGVVYVGDRPAHDVEPALRVGITPILLDRADRYPHAGSYRRIGSLSELPAALRPSPPMASE